MLYQLSIDIPDKKLDRHHSYNDQLGHSMINMNMKNMNIKHMKDVGEEVFAPFKVSVYCILKQ